MAISRSHKKEIEEVANKLIQQLDVDSLPVDLETIAQKVGLNVEYFPFSNEISGLLKKEMGVVGINDTHPPRRRRFTLAHEIGHYVLGHNIIDDRDLVDDTETDTTSVNEREANYFASVILMPESKVREATRSGINIKELAGKFEVSEQAMTIRVLEIGLIK